MGATSRLKVGGTTGACGAAKTPPTADADSQKPIPASAAIDTTPRVVPRIERCISCLLFQAKGEQDVPRPPVAVEYTRSEPSTEPVPQVGEGDLAPYPWGSDDSTTPIICSARRKASSSSPS